MENKKQHNKEEIITEQESIEEILDVESAGAGAPEEIKE
jgi:hypothetical protein